MSRNLVELVRRHHARGAPTALEVLKEAMDDHGEITDDDRRVAAERSGLPEAAVYGVSTFYDDLLAPRGARHVRVCTGTACFAADRRRARRRGRATALGLELGERARGRRGLARRDRLPRLLPRVARGARRRRRSTPARARSSACSPARRAPAAEPRVASAARRAGADRAAATGRACARALDELTPEELLERGQGGRRPRPRRRRLPRRARSGSSPRGGRRATRSSSSPTATRATPAPTSTSS